MAFQYSATQALSQLGRRHRMYVWITTRRSCRRCIPHRTDFKRGLESGAPMANSSSPKDCSPPIPAKSLADWTFQAKDYFGDHSGFGYNWAFLEAILPYRRTPVHLSQLCGRGCDGADPLRSQLIAFATSSYFNATWLPHGDGQVYDLGVIDAPMFWHGNPNVDFRFEGTRVPDAAAKVVFTNGNAPVFYVDGHVAVRKQTQLQNTNFTLSGE